MKVTDGIVSVATMSAIVPIILRKKDLFKYPKGENLEKWKIPFKIITNNLKA